jgi:acetoin utilization deacetylase AcuC-like enzyme
MTDRKATLLITDELMMGHDPAAGAGPPGAGHPERPARLGALLADFSQHPIAGVTRAAPRPATIDELTAVHHREHVEAMAALGGQHAQIEADTSVSPGSWPAALLAAGGAVAAVEAVWQGRAENAFVWARPPGHHAEAAFAMGFCLFNNVAVAAAAGRRLGAARVLIVDWDVHHGNGTQHIFEQRRDILTMSAHQYPLYPGTGAADEIGKGEGRGHVVNCALPAGQTDADYGQVFERLFVPIAEAFKPDLILVSAGFDAHAADPLAEMRVTERGFAAMCTATRRLAEAHCQGRLVLVLEGGYNLTALVGSSRACLEVLTGRDEEFPSGSDRAGSAVTDSRAALAAHWPALPR